MLLAIALLLYVLLTWFLPARSWLAGWADTLVAASILAAGQIVGVQLALGLAGLLRPGPLLAANLLIGAGSLVLNRRLLSVVLDELRSSVAGMLGWMKRSPVALLLAGLLLLVMGSMLLLAWLLPETSYDGLAYHLPIAFSRLDRGDMSRLTGWPPWIAGYPESSELLMLWTFIFDRNLALVDAVQWPFWALGTLATYGLGRKLGARPQFAFAGMAVFAFAPAVIHQSRVAYNDLMIAALFLGGLNILLGSRGWRSALVAGTAAGLIAGTKYAGAIYALGMLAGLLALAWVIERRAGRALPTGALWKRIVAFLAPVLVLSVPWYLANWLADANPLWPFTVQVGERTLFHGLFTVQELYSTALEPAYRNWWRLALNPYLWLEPVTTYGYDARYAGLGILWVVLGIPALLYALLMSRRQELSGLLWLLALTASVYVLLPNNWCVRYALFLPAIGGVCLGLTLTRAPLWLARFATLCLLTGALFSVFAAAPVPPGAQGGGSADAGRRTRLGLLDWPAYAWLNRQTSAGATVAYAYGLYFIAPLWGDDLRNRVVYAGRTPAELA